MKTNDEAEKIINESSYHSIDIESAERSVKRHIRVALNVNQFSALVSFRVSLSHRDFLDSVVIKLLNKGEYKLAALHFQDHVKGATSQGTKHLESRRRKERRLFERPDLEVVVNKGKTPGVSE